MTDNLIWIGIFLCLTQSAMFSGLNLAFFNLSRLRLEAEAASGNKTASKILTFAGEIFPQAYFSRRAMTMAGLLGPVLRMYQFILYPVAKPSAWMLDKWLGAEHTEYLHERQLKGVIERHIESESAEIDFVEGRGALNFLDIDDIPISMEGECVDEGSPQLRPRPKANHGIVDDRVEKTVEAFNIR
jgi:metal transporter CNNM